MEPRCRAPGNWLAGTVKGMLGPKLYVDMSDDAAFDDGIAHLIREIVTVTGEPSSCTVGGPPHPNRLPTVNATVVPVPVVVQAEAFPNHNLGSASTITPRPQNTAAVTSTSSVHVPQKRAPSPTSTKQKWPQVRRSWRGRRGCVRDCCWCACGFVSVAGINRSWSFSTTSTNIPT